MLLFRPSISARCTSTSLQNESLMCKCVYPVNGKGKHVQILVYEKRKLTKANNVQPELCLSALDIKPWHFLWSLNLIGYDISCLLGGCKA